MQQYYAKPRKKVFGFVKIPPGSRGGGGLGGLKGVRWWGGTGFTRLDNAASLCNGIADQDHNL